MGNKSIYQKKLQINLDSLSPDQMEVILFQMKNCICKIKLKNEVGTGFFCRIPFPNKKYILHALITCNHFLGNNNLNLGNKIELFLDCQKAPCSLLINKSRKIYTNKKKDITIIEIIPDYDKIKQDSFLDVDDIIFEEQLKNNYENSSIYIIYYEKNRNIKYSVGTIKRITEDKNQVFHSCKIEKDSPGSPIIDLYNYKVIGIHKGRYDKGTNYGILLKSPIDEFKSNFENIINEKNMLESNEIKARFSGNQY